ncbi:secreted RxLR effector protein 161-like [Aristolochia californica]|uniref:secreted RxLR effector protein 161-like n=1 Tax=Aristolochia californica TaxID=171875 RepID=UPI0035E1EC7E
MEVNTKLSINDSSEKVDNNLYRKLVGSLIFLCNTRPEISYGVGVLSRFSNNPSKTHWQGGMQILKYLKGTLTFGVSYTRRDILFGYCDSDWAGDIDTRKSVTGYEFLFGSGIISWANKKQQTVALSSTEAEYKAACVAACEAVWLRRILTDIGIPLTESTTLNFDSQSCIAMAKNPVFHARTKHIEIQYHYVRELIEEEPIYMEYCPTEDNHADIFTKALGSAQMNKHLHGLGVGPRT